jgi:endonuclease YncB( thermonuclease family)
MKHIILALAAYLALLSPLHAQVQQPGALRYVDSGQLFVIDGDTVVYRGYHLRFLGIEAPELRAPCMGERLLAQQARQAVVQDLANARSVQLRFYYTKSARYGDYRVRAIDKYGRALVDIFVNGQSLAQTLIDRGLAVSWNGQGAKPNWC